MLVVGWWFVCWCRLVGWLLRVASGNEDGCLVVWLISLLVGWVVAWLLRSFVL